MNTTRFPVGGSRQAVYNYLSERGFVMSKWSDKHWLRADGVEVQVYGSGSKARITKKEETIADGSLEYAIAQLETGFMPT